MQRQHQERQDADGNELSERCENYKKDFFRYIGQKKEAKENVPPLINEKGKLISTDTDKAVVLNEFFA